MISEMLLIIPLFVTLVYFTINERVFRIRKVEVKVDHALSSIIALLILLITGAISLGAVFVALSYQQNIIPWQILIVFFGSAYICASLDASGILRVIAYKFAMSAKNGKSLFFTLIALAGIMTVFTSNDIVTLTFTPIIVYLSQYLSLNPLLFLIPVFFTSNTWSMFFYIGNPTNVIVSQAYDLTFFGYAKYMFLPTIFAIIVSVVLFYIKYRKKLPDKIEINYNKNETIIRNKSYAMFSSILFILFFIFVAIGDFIHLELWMVVLAFVILYLLLNLFYSPLMSKDEKELFNEPLHFFKQTILKVPWKLFPVVITFFVFVYLFNQLGITSYLGSLFNYNNVFLETMVVSLVSALVANIMINQPMTILFSVALAGKPLHYALAIVLGSNIGGNITLLGAFAGLMWSKMLKDYGIEMNNKIFIKETFVVSMITIIAAAIGIYLSVILF